MRCLIQEWGGRAIYLKARALPAMFAGALVLMAYQPGGTSTHAASLEEAKRITSEFSGSFTAPP